MQGIRGVVGTFSSQLRFFYFSTVAKMTAVLRGTVLLLAALLGSGVLAQSLNSAPAHDDAPSRLSGIIAIDEDRGIAIVETANDHTAVVREGDPFEGGRVLKISQKTMRVHYPQGDKLYWLTASGVKVSDAMPLTHLDIDKLVIERHESGSALQRTVAKGPVVAWLDALMAPTAPDKSATLEQLLAPLLDLPKQARIVEIDHKPLGTTKESLTAIRESLARSSVARLGIEGDPGIEVVYLMPRDPSEADGARPAGQ